MSSWALWASGTILEGSNLRTPSPALVEISLAG
jgi:hypothetical protein